MTKLLQQRGVYLDGDPGEDELSQQEPLLAACVAGSLQNRQVLGPQAGQRVLALGGGRAAAGLAGGAGHEDAEGAASRKPAHGFDNASRSVSEATYDQRSHIALPEDR